MTIRRRDLLKAGTAAMAAMAIPGVLKAGEAATSAKKCGDMDSPELDLREFLPSGFVIDGSKDYSKEIQSCVSAGKRIFIPAGIWLCENLNVRGYRNIRGAGRANTVLKTSPGSNSFLLNAQMEKPKTGFRTLPLLTSR